MIIQLIAIVIKTYHEVSAIKKKFRWAIAILVIILGIILISSNSNYEITENLYGFPIPITAELVQESERVKSYNWSRASEENGIPLDYEIVLKLNGWKKGEREGANVLYTKGNHTINLASYHKVIDIMER